jgi:hypothetical protein
MYTTEPLKSKFAKKLETKFLSDFVKIKDNASDNYCMMTQKFVDTSLERVKNFEVFEDDIWIVTYPKCGTTWTQELLWMVNNDLSYEDSMKEPLLTRFPYLE